MSDFNNNSTSGNGNGRTWDFFATFRNLVTCWMSVLSALELQVYLAYLMHADQHTGIAYPGPRLIANYVGHAKPQHVRAARRRLIRNGLLVKVHAGGGRESGRFKVGHPTRNPGYPKN